MTGRAFSIKDALVVETQELLNNASENPRDDIAQNPEPERSRYARAAYWMNVLTEAYRSNQLEALLYEALGESPNPELRAAVRAYRAREADA